jgi:hypothetical protein
MGVTGSSRKDKARARSARNSPCVVRGEQAASIGFAWSCPGYGPPWLTGSQFDGLHWERLGRLIFDEFARFLEEGLSLARVPQRFCAVVHSRAEASRLLQCRGTVLDVWPRQTSFSPTEAYYPRAARQLQTQCALRPKCWQSQNNLKVNKIYQFRQIFSIIVIVRDPVRFGMIRYVQNITGTIILSSNKKPLVEQEF